MPVKVIWSQDKLDLIRNIFPVEGAGKLAKLLGVDNQTILNRAKEMNLKSPRQKKIEDNHTHLDESYFLKWSPKMAYDLGNGFADGSVRTGKYGGYTLEVQTLDESVILGTRDRIGSKHEIHRRIRESVAKTGYLCHMTQICITNKATANILADQHGMIPDKSNNDVDLPSVPIELLNHFARGYLDGDGCVSMSHKDNPSKRTKKLYYKGSHKFITSLVDLLLVQIPLLTNPS